MKNYWWVTRPKRKLIQVPELFAAFMAANVETEWRAEREKHITFESILENDGYKRKGDRRDKKGGGGRTYAAWFYSLGLFFYHNNKIYPTLAGEDLLKGKPPLEVLKKQVINYQFPSPYSLSRNVLVNNSFNIRPFRFLLRLLIDQRINYLTEDETAKIIIGEAFNESNKCFEFVVENLLRYRTFGDKVLRIDFCEYYSSRTGEKSFNDTIKNLRDVANTIFNWIEYTQLAHRVDGKLRATPEKIIEINSILNDNSTIINRADEEEYFQRKFGIGIYRKKDTRNVNDSQNITSELATRRMIKSRIFSITSKKPVFSIDSLLINEIYNKTGADKEIIIEELQSFKHGMLDIFEASYYDMAFMGRDKCKEFEEATNSIFNNVFKLNSHLVANKGLHPDIYVDSNKITGIIDTKAYASYSISNDHKNRMTVNYIPNYKKENPNLSFFMYVAGGFGKNINKQLTEIAKISGVNGCGITAPNMISIARAYKNNKIDNDILFRLFRKNEEINF